MSEYLGPVVAEEEEEDDEAGVETTAEAAVAVRRFFAGAEESAGVRLRELMVGCCLFGSCCLGFSVHVDESNFGKKIQIQILVVTDCGVSRFPCKQFLLSGPEKFSENIILFSTHVSTY